VGGDLSAGSYYVKASGSGYIDQFYDGLTYDSESVWPPVGASPVSVGLETNTPGINFSLKLYGSISGRVSRRSDGTGLPNIQIGVYDPTWKWVASASTDSYGSYAVSRLPTGNYYVKTWNNEGYLDLYYDNVPTKIAARLVSIDGGLNTSNINFSLDVELSRRISYRMQPNASYFYETGEHQVASWTGSRDDGYFDLDLADFDFQFYGFPVHSLRIATNGYVTFGAGGSTFLNSFIPDIPLPNAFIAPFWDDLDLTNLTEGRGVWWGLLGTPPNRRLVIEWHEVPSRQYRTEAYSFETILYESTDRIKFQYLNVSSGTSHDWGGSATVGIENFEGTEGVQYTFNGSTLLSNGLAIELIPEQLVENTVYISKDGQCSGYDPCFPNIQNGIASAFGTTEVQITQDEYNENIILDFDQVIFLSGGWNTNFAWCPSYTTITGSIAITHGTIILENIIVK
jgi:hypothetical protein